MPELSRFFGIVVIAGRLPPRAAGLVVEWASMHQDELRDRWQSAQSMQPLSKIEPLS